MKNKKSKGHPIHIYLTDKEYEYLKILQDDCGGSEYKSISSLIRQIIWYYKNC